MTSPWSKAGPSRAGPWRRSSRVCGTILLQLLEICFVFFPADIPHVSLLQKHLPLLPRDDQRVGHPVRVFGGARAPKAKGSSVARIAQNLERRAVVQWSPVDLALVRASPDPMGKEDPLCAEILHGGRGRARAFERGEQHTHRRANLGVRIKDHRVILCVGQADR
jgi:hypothetical protein